MPCAGSRLPKCQYYPVASARWSMVLCSPDGSLSGEAKYYNTMVRHRITPHLSG